MIISETIKNVQRAHRLKVAMPVIGASGGGWILDILVTLFYFHFANKVHMVYMDFILY